MRLLERDDIGEFRLTGYLPENEIPPYAILSHTWGDEEVLFKDLADGTAKKKEGYAKLRFCGDQAERDGLKFFWIDTCCIDKSDAKELQHSLNSMFRWYRDAAKCYVYLADVSIRQQKISDRPPWTPGLRRDRWFIQPSTPIGRIAPIVVEFPAKGGNRLGGRKCLKPEIHDGSSWKVAFRQSRWFTRGWTLQELIAPTTVDFFSKEGKRLGNKKTLEQDIHDITGIALRALNGDHPSNFSVAERMAWIENRHTKYEEDMVYAMFGIFEVNITVNYGEGKHSAFRRLQEKIDKDYDRLAKLWSTEPRDPRVEKKRIELAKGGLLVDPYRWVFDNPDFNRWRQLSESRLLWIKGDPGKGKTMLLCGIINELERPITINGGNLAYFFCQATDSRNNNATSVLRGLIYVLVQRQPRLLSHLPENTYPSDDAMAWIVLSKTLLEMLEDPNMKVTYLVIDALDECMIDQQKLLSLIVQISSVSARVKLVVSSRNLVEIEEQLAAVAQQSRLSLELNAESVTAAVETFIRHKVLSLSAQKNYDKKTEDEVHQYLSCNADGTFLWVALVCQALGDPNVREWQTLDKLHAFPPGLDSLYEQMMKYINDSDDADLCRRILATATVVRRPINLPELITLVEMPKKLLKKPEYLEELIKLCGSFLTLRERVVSFVHQSAKDFLHGKAAHQASREAFNRIFPHGMETVNHTIFSRSLNTMLIVLRRDIYRLKSPGFPINEVQTPSPDPLASVRYSCVFWIDHLCNSISHKGTPQPNTLDAVRTFFEQKYLYWLEALSLLQAMPEGVIAITQLNSFLGRTGTSQLTKLVWDAYRFTLAYGWVVEQAPLQVYASALVFAPASSVVKNKFRAEEPRWISTKPVVEADWNACLQTLEGHNKSVQSVAFSPDGQRLASGSDDSTIKIWDPASGQYLQTLEGHSNSVRSVAFSPDGQRLASGSGDKTIKIWDPASGQCLQTLEGHSSWVESVAFSLDGQRLASGSHDKTIKIWDPASGQYLQTLEGHNKWVRSVAFSPDGQRLASGSDDSTIKIWNPASGQCLQTLKGHSDWVLSVTFSLDGQRLASGSLDKTIKIWDPASGQYLQTLEGHSDWVLSVTFSLDGQRLASGSHDNTIKIWDPASGQCLQTLEGHSDSVHSVTFSRDGQRLASGSGDKTIKIWDPASGQYLQTLEGHSDWVLLVTFSLDGQRLASGSSDCTIKIWDPASGQYLQMLEGHNKWVRSVAFSPDGQRLASGSDDSTIKIWNPASGQCLQTLKGHSDWVLSVTFSLDGQRLASGSHDNTIKIWDPASGQCLQTLRGHYSSVHSFFSLDNPEGYGYSLGKDQTWIVCNGRSLIWLPPEYRPSCSAVQGRMVAIGCYSGRVFTIGFLYDV